MKTFKRPLLEFSPTISEELWAYEVWIGVDLIGKYDTSTAVDNAWVRVVGENSNNGKNHKRTLAIE